MSRCVNVQFANMIFICVSVYLSVTIFSCDYEDGTWLLLYLLKLFIYYRIDIDISRFVLCTDLATFPSPGGFACAACGSF